MMTDVFAALLPMFFVSKDIATYQQEFDNLVEPMLSKKNSTIAQQYVVNPLLSWQQLESGLHNFRDFSNAHLTERLSVATVNAQNQ